MRMALSCLAAPIQVKATLSIFGVFTDQDGTAASVDLTGRVGRVCVLTISQSIPAVLDPTVTSTIPISSHRADPSSALDVLDHLNSSSSLQQASATAVVNEYLFHHKKLRYVLSMTFLRKPLMTLPFHCCYSSHRYR